MPNNRPARVVFILAVGIILALIANNLYRRYINGALAAAVTARDVVGVRRALERGADPNYAIPMPAHDARIMPSNPAARQSVLQLAFSGIIDEQRVGVPAHSPIQSVNPRGEEIVKLLILKGAHTQDINFVNQACSLGDVPLTRFLLDHGADLTLPGNSNATQSALIYGATYLAANGVLTGISAAVSPSDKAQATQRRDTAHQLIQLLAAHGAHITLTQAQEIRDSALMQRMLDGAEPIDAQDGYFAMTRAASDADIATIRLLLKRGIEANPPRHGQMEIPAAPGAIYDTPLHVAVTKGQVAVVALLLEHGADPNVTHPFNPEPALTAAIGRKDPALVKLLLAHGARVNASGYFAPLARAAGQGDLNMMQLLMARGAKVNADGYSPALEAAISARHPAIVRFLLAHGATTATQPHIPYPNLSMALTSLPEVVPDLLKYGGPVNLPPRPPFFERQGFPGGNTGFMFGQQRFLPRSPLAASLWYAPQYEATLVKAGATLGWEKQYVCAGAAREKRMDLLPKLLAYGADINGMDANHDTALAICVESDPQNVQTLLEHGANPNLVSSVFRYPLEEAAITGNTGLVRLLLAHGANVNARYRQGHTALYWARRKNHADIVALLQQAGATE